jgi:hypothetical protein
MNDKNAKFAVEYFKTANKTFEFSAGYNFAKIKTDDNKRYYFYSEHKNLKLLGLASQIKAQVNKKVDKSIIQIFLPLLYIENSHVYDVQINKNTAFEYDINNAFSHWLYLLWVSKETFNKMLDIKRKYNFNVNQSIGMALLGEKIVAKYTHGKPLHKEIVLNPLRPCFYLLRYLTIYTLKRTLALEAYDKRIAYYVDAIHVTEKLNISMLAKAYDFNAYETLESLENKAQKYYNKSFSEAFGIDKERIANILYNRDCKTSFFSFKEKEISNVNIVKYELTNKNILQFERENELVTYK